MKIRGERGKLFLVKKVKLFAVPQVSIREEKSL